MGVATAQVDGKTIAQANAWETVEGNIYFPPDAVSDKSIFSDSKTTTSCPWKGKAAYYNISVDGHTLQDAAWYYPQPKDGAKNIKDYIAFYKSKVQVTST